MPEKSKPFRKKLRQARPDLTERQVKNARKREIAIKLRALRDARGLTQAEVAEAAGMTQSMVARLEALSGLLPGLDSIERFVEACGGYMELLISTEKIGDEGGFKEAFVRARGRVPADLDLEIDGAVEILGLIEAWTGSHAQAVAWYDTEPLPSFGNLTAAELVRRGRAEAVKAYIERISDGGYA